MHTGADSSPRTGPDARAWQSCGVDRERLQSQESNACKVVRSIKPSDCPLVPLALGLQMRRMEILTRKLFARAQ
jgi:hypothetical protein